LKSYREWSPFVNFMGWLGDIPGFLPQNGSSASGCAKAPHCQRGMAVGSHLCSDCAASEAARCLDNPRFMNANKFDAVKSYAALCEDIITGTSVEWFTKKSTSKEIRKAIVNDDELINDIMEGNVYVHVESQNSRAFLRSKRNPMTVASLRLQRVWQNAGLLGDQLERKLQTADVVSGDIGVGWKVSNLPLTFLEGKEEPDSPLSPKMTVEEQIGLLSGDPALKEIAGETSTYWIFLKDGVLTLWRDCPVRVNSWWINVKKWKNSIPGLSSSVDLLLCLVAMFLIYLAYTATHDTIVGYLDWFWRKWKGSDVQHESSDLVEPEGRGIRSRFVARAAPTSHKEQHRSDMGVSSGVGSAAGGGYRERHEGPVGDANWQRMVRGSSDALDLGRTKDKEFIMYDLHDVEKQLSTPQGVIMYNHLTRQSLRVHNMEQYRQMREAGWKVNSGSLLKADRISIPLEAVRSSPELARALKVLQFFYNYRGIQFQPNTRLSAAEKGLLEKYLGVGIEKAPAGARAAFAIASSPSKGKVSHREAEEFADFSRGTDAGIDHLEVEGDFSEISLSPVEQGRYSLTGDEDSKSDPGVVFQGKPKLWKKPKLSPESNIQVLQSRKCVVEANGGVCRNKSCPREHEKDMVESLREEALVHPELKEIDPLCFYAVCKQVDGDLVQFGSAVSTAYGFLTARHVLFDNSGMPRFSLDEMVVRCADGSVSNIDPKTVVCPRAEQLAQGQEHDFCKFRVLSMEFNMVAQKHRVWMRKYQKDDKTVRMLRSPRDNLHGSPMPVVEVGGVISVDHATGVVRNTLNTVKSDSGSPVFDADGYCIGIHQGSLVKARQNVFLLFYPVTANPWFCQTEPKN